MDRTLGDVTDTAWDEITQTIDASPYPVTVLPPNPSRATECLAALGITTRLVAGRGHRPQRRVAGRPRLATGVRQRLGRTAGRGTMTQFYESLRRPGWEDEVAQLSLAQGIHAWPPPSTVEGRDLASASRAPIPVAELVSFHHDMSRQLGGHDGPFEVRITP
jgi:Protein of unknown function DUF2625